MTELILVDFDGRRSEASFGSWPEALSARGRVIPGATDPDLPRTLDAYLKRIIESEPACTPSVVVGYCASAGIAEELAFALGRAGERPPAVVAVDPVRMGPADFVEACAEALHALSGGRAAMSLTAADVESDPDQALQRALRDVTVQAATALGVPPEKAASHEVAALLAERYHRWLRYLNLAMQCRWPAWDNAVIEIDPADSTETMTWPNPGRVVAHRLPVGRADALGSPVVHRLLTQLLDR